MARYDQDNDVLYFGKQEQFAIHPDGPMLRCATAVDISDQIVNGASTHDTNYITIKVEDIDETIAALTMLKEHLDN